ARFRQFTVVEADRSLAARQQFSERIGLITAAFYYGVPSEGARGERVGTDAGREGRTSLKSMSYRPGDLIAVGNIRQGGKEGGSVTVVAPQPVAAAPDACLGVEWDAAWLARREGCRPAQAPQRLRRLAQEVAALVGALTARVCGRPVSAEAPPF